MNIVEPVSLLGFPRSPSSLSLVHVLKGLFADERCSSDRISADVTQPGKHLDTMTFITDITALIISYFIDVISYFISWGCIMLRSPQPKKVVFLHTHIPHTKTHSVTVNL